MKEDEAKRSADSRKVRETLRVHNALTRTKLRQVEKRCAVLMTALSNIAGAELPEGFRPADYRLPEHIDGVGDGREMIDCIQDYALFVLNSGGGQPDQLAVVGYVQDSKVYCMDCSKQQKGSMKPVRSGVDMVVCASCGAGLFVE